MEYNKHDVLYITLYVDMCRAIIHCAEYAVDEKSFANFINTVTITKPLRWLATILTLRQ